MLFSFTLSYRRDKSHLSPEEELALEVSDDPHSSSYSWKNQSGIDPDAGSMNVFNLVPNSTYYFRVTAVNRLGPGLPVSVMADTKFEAKEVDQAKELIRAQEQEDEERSYLK